jgi:hypothetical protein
MIPERSQTLLDAPLRMEIRKQQEDGEEEEKCPDEGPFDDVGGLFGWTWS